MSATSDWSSERDATPMAAVLRLAWPIVVSQLATSTMMVADAWFVSQLGVAETAGVGVAVVLNSGLLWFPIGAVRTVKTLIAQSAARGRSTFHPYFVAAIVMSCAWGVLVGLAALLFAYWLPALTATKESGLFARDYLVVRALGSVPLLMLIAIEEVRIALGDSRSVMVASLVGNGACVLLDYLAVCKLELGVVGAAWASNLAITGELLLLAVVHVRRDGLDLRAMRREHFAALMRLGIPTGIQTGLEMGSLGLLAVLLASFDERHAAANQIGIQILQFATLPAMALSEAGSVLVGRALGAHQRTLVGVIARVTLLATLAYAIMCGAFVVACDRIIAGLFTHDSVLQHLMRSLLVLLGAFQVLNSVGLVARGVLRGLGDVRFVAVVGTVAAWVCTPPLTYLLGLRLGWGVYGAWLGVCAQSGIAAAVLWRRIPGMTSKAEAILAH